MSKDLLTHLQFAAVRRTVGREIRGRDLRDDLIQDGFSLTAPSFYQLMGRLEEAGFVRGEIRTRFLAGQLIKEKFYRAEGAGIAAANRTKEFYLSMPAKGVAGVSHA